MRTLRFVGVDCGAAFSQSKVTAEGGYRVSRISPIRWYELESHSSLGITSCLGTRTWVPLKQKGSASI
jgi:hypothetical protein